MPGVATHLLAPVNRAAAAALALPRTLPAAPGVALTFDDGPHPEGTPAILELLARHRATATFFVVGEQVRRRPALLARIRAQGHQVALHGDRHRLQLRLGRDGAARRPAARGAAAIEDALGEPPALAPAAVRDLQPGGSGGDARGGTGSRCCGHAGARTGDG